ncbi:hypothetical protein [Streptodolium elevatio]|uniref:Uncharacterized protein n=1 Tax=Streptodolium elevatio TaxID=3157996 RepID=A0ABV3DJW7_9ACTN
MTPDDFDAVLAEAYDEPAFSNGSEGYGFMWANCDHCIHDKPHRDDTDPRGCPVIGVTMLGKRPRQFVDGPRDAEGRYSRAHQYVCTEYRHEDDGPPDPQPIPDPPGQDGLFPREDHEGVRMLTALPTREHVGGGSRG